MADKPVILALVSSEPIRQVMTQHGEDFDLRWSLDAMIGHHVDHPEVVAIAALNPALIIIELDRAAAWLPYVRSDPATRRIPVIAIADDEVAQQRAKTAKVDATFTTQDFMAALPGLFFQYARIFRDSDALNQECDQSLPAEAIKGLEEFNAHEYYECHETLEHIWMNEPGPIRNLYRVILQIGIAYYQIERRNYRGAQKMFRRTLQWFAPLPDRCQSVNVAQLRKDAAAAWEHLEALGPDHIGDYDRSLLKPVIYDAPSKQEREAHG